MPATLNLPLSAINLCKRDVDWIDISFCLFVRGKFGGNYINITKIKIFGIKQYFNTFYLRFFKKTFEVNKLGFKRNYNKVFE